MTIIRKPRAKAQPKARSRRSSDPILKNDVEHLTDTVRQHIAETSAFRKEMREEINAINQLLARYKGALGLLALIGSAVIAGVTVVAQYFFRT